MRLRTAIVLAMLALVGTVTAGVSVAVGAIVERAAWEDMRGDLDRAVTIVSETWSARLDVGAARARMVADEPRLRAVVATADISRSTILGVVGDVDRDVRSDLFLLADHEGILLGDPHHPDDEGYDLRSIGFVDRAIGDGASSSGILADEDFVFRAHAQPIAFGEHVVGALVLGDVLDDAMASALSRETGTEVCFLLGDRVVASSRADLAVPSLANVGLVASSVSVAGHAWLAIAPVVDTGTDAPLRCVLLRSIDDALAPSRSLRWLVLAMGAVSFLVAALVAFFASRALAQPIDGMVAFARRVAAGDLTVRAPSAGPLEVRALGVALDRMVVDLEASRSALVERNRMEKELEIASRLQTSLLPRSPCVPGLDVAAHMEPASEVGGDYYDVLPYAGGAWIAIGDVAGHGLPAGIVMLMVRTGLAALVGDRCDLAPSEIVTKLNALVYDSVHERLGTGEHVTFCLLRHEGDGRFRYAGAHEDLVVWRSATGRCERIPTAGTWLGVTPDVASATVDRELVLGPDDVLFLMSDGLFERVGPDGLLLGVDAVVEAVDALSEPARRPLDELIDEVLVAIGERASEPAHDDVTLVVVRRTP